MNNSPEVDSPLSVNGKAKRVGAVKTSHIIGKYRDAFGLDVAEYFPGMQEVGIYECSKTGYRFYHPPSLAGKDSLYRHLGRFPWFYQHDKWEHGVALRHLRAGHRVLDVGCGTGNFLDAAKAITGGDVAGIELNPDSAKAARERGLSVDGILIEDHARSHPVFYDVVSTFQVLEHISDVGGFIRACIEALKPGGLFIVGVPNNEGFLKYDGDAVLNGPPHHMGLWTRTSLEALCGLFPLEVLAVDIEPLKEVDWFQSVMERRYIRGRLARSVYHRFGGAGIFRKFLVENATSIAGHTIMVVFRKTSA
ncbi:MAG: methyltransferase domain-containing protein [Betaproteobacteria bacterium]